MIHYFGKNLATMRTIVVIMAMSTLATAQERWAYAKVLYNTRSQGHWGDLDFYQPAPNFPVEISTNGSPVDLKHYVYYIHENGDLTQRCLSTGSLLEFMHNDRENTMHARVWTSKVTLKNDTHPLGFVKTVLSRWLISLAPNAEYSIINRAIVIHKRKEFRLPYAAMNGNHDSTVGCGIVMSRPITSVAPNVAFNITTTIPFTNTSTSPSTTTSTSPSTTTSTSPFTTTSTTVSGICGVIKRFFNF